MPTYEVKCIRRCFDNTLARRYWPGDMAKIDPISPLAQYFEGFPPGVEVYHKVRGSKTEPVKETVKVIPGAAAVAPLAPEPPAPVAAPAGEVCPDCGKGPFKNLGAHQQHCEAFKAKAQV